MKIKRLTALLSAAALLLCGCSINKADPPSGNDPPLPPTKEGKLEELISYSFDAGKADAHLIYNSKFAVLIDCGEKGFGKTIAEYMDSHGIKKLDLLIVTHFDKDHVGGAAKVIKEIPVETVIQSNCPKDSSEYSNYLQALADKGIEPVTLREMKSWRLGDAEVTVYPPMREEYVEDPSNNSSLITAVRYGSKSMLYAGDAQDQRMNEFIMSERHTFDMVKVPYHGHFQQRLGAFLSSTSPIITVITSSDELPEDRKTLDIISGIGASVYLTRTAPVIVSCDGESIAARYEE
ncbi:MAG: MBL fold metallo-hydrolase [Ruminococcus sp.]|nr:MBL fold metallo-hydrolase [Ruminococcus sp.]